MLYAKTLEHLGKHPINVYYDTSNRTGPVLYIREGSPLSVRCLVIETKRLNNYWELSWLKTGLLGVGLRPPSIIIMKESKSSIKYCVFLALLGYFHNCLQCPWCSHWYVFCSSIDFNRSAIAWRYGNLRDILKGHGA